MDIKAKVVVVTGGASGIGAALCRRFAVEDAEGIVVVDKAGGVVNVTGLRDLRRTQATATRTSEEAASFLNRA